MPMIKFYYIFHIYVIAYKIQNIQHIKTQNLWITPSQNLWEWCWDLVIYFASTHIISAVCAVFSLMPVKEDMFRTFFLIRICTSHVLF